MNGVTQWSFELQQLAQPPEYWPYKHGSPVNNFLLFSFYFSFNTKTNYIAQAGLESSLHSYELTVPSASFCIH